MATSTDKSARLAAGAAAPGGISPAMRERIAQGFTRVEDLVYVGLGVLLAASAVVLLLDGVVDFARGLLEGAVPARVIELLDRILLILMIVEILYTVQVSLYLSGRIHR